MLDGLTCKINGLAIMELSVTRGTPDSRPAIANVGVAYTITSVAGPVIAGQAVHHDMWSDDIYQKLELLLKEMERHIAGSDLFTGGTAEADSSLEITGIVD
jgi:hypothetical protein